MKDYLPPLGRTLSQTMKDYLPPLGRTLSPTRKDYVPLLGRTLSPTMKDYLPLLGSTLSSTRKDAGQRLERLSRDRQGTPPPNVRRTGRPPLGRSRALPRLLRTPFHLGVTDLGTRSSPT